MVYPLWRIVWWFPVRLSIQLPYSPAVVPLGIYPAVKICVHTQKNLHTNIHGSFICNSPQLETIQKSFSRYVIKQLWCAHTMEHYSAVKKGHTVDIYINPGESSETMLSDKANTRRLHTV